MKRPIIALIFIVSFSMFCTLNVDTVKDVVETQKYAKGIDTLLVRGFCTNGKFTIDTIPDDTIKIRIEMTRTALKNEKDGILDVRCFIDTLNNNTGWINFDQTLSNSWQMYRTILPNFSTSVQCPSRFGLQFLGLDIETLHLRGFTGYHKIKLQRDYYDSLTVETVLGCSIMATYGTRTVIVKVLTDSSAFHDIIVNGVYGITQSPELVRVSLPTGFKAWLLCEILENGSITIDSEVIKGKTYCGSFNSGDTNTRVISLKARNKIEILVE